MALTRKEIRKISYRRHKAQELARMKQWRAMHKAEQLTYNREYRRLHPKEVKQAKAAWREAHRMETRSRERIRYEARKAAGLCVMCGREPPRSGRVDCLVCADKARRCEFARIQRLHPKFGQRALHLLKDWGLTLEQWTAMFVTQGKHCAICLTDKPGGRWWHIDHDHRFTKKDPSGHRGILCHGCNKAIGMLKDDPYLLERAAAYLRKHKALRAV